MRQVTQKKAPVKGKNFQQELPGNVPSLGPHQEREGGKRGREKKKKKDDGRKRDR